MTPLQKGLRKAERGVKFDDLPPKEQLAVFQALQQMLWNTKIKPRREAARNKREAEKRGSGMNWMITVVERKDVVTRVVFNITSEVMARDTLKDLRDKKMKKGWLAVSLSQVAQPPSRTKEEKERAFNLLYT